jgi:hypothetical protein
MKGHESETGEAIMSTAPAGAVCERCGGEVSTNEEGRITCTGCNLATDSCTCTPQTA